MSGRMDAMPAPPSSRREKEDDEQRQSMSRVTPTGQGVEEPWLGLNRPHTHRGSRAWTACP